MMTVFTKISDLLKINYLGCSRPILFLIIFQISFCYVACELLLPGNDDIYHQDLQFIEDNP